MTRLCRFGVICRNPKAAVQMAASLRLCQGLEIGQATSMISDLCTSKRHSPTPHNMSLRYCTCCSRTVLTCSGVGMAVGGSALATRSDRTRATAASITSIAFTMGVQETSSRRHSQHRLSAARYRFLPPREDRAESTSSLFARSRYCRSGGLAAALIEEVHPRWDRLSLASCLSGALEVCLEMPEWRRCFLSTKLPLGDWPLMMRSQRSCDVQLGAPGPGLIPLACLAEASFKPLAERWLMCKSPRLSAVALIRCQLAVARATHDARTSLQFAGLAGRDLRFGLKYLAA